MRIKKFNILRSLSNVGEKPLTNVGKNDFNVHRTDVNSKIYLFFFLEPVLRHFEDPHLKRGFGLQLSYHLTKLIF